MVSTTVHLYATVFSLRTRIDELEAAALHHNTYTTYLESQLFHERRLLTYSTAQVQQHRQRCLEKKKIISALKHQERSQTREYRKKLSAVHAEATTLQEKVVASEKRLQEDQCLQGFLLVLLALQYRRPLETLHTHRIERVLDALRSHCGGSSNDSLPQSRGAHAVPLPGNTNDPRPADRSPPALNARTIEQMLGCISRHGYLSRPLGNRVDGALDAVLCTVAATDRATHVARSANKEATQVVNHIVPSAVEQPRYLRAIRNKSNASPFFTPQDSPSSTLHPSMSPSVVNLPLPEIKVEAEAGMPRIVEPYDKLPADYSELLLAHGRVINALRAAEAQIESLTRDRQRTEKEIGVPSIVAGNHNEYAKGLPPRNAGSVIADATATSMLDIQAQIADLTLGALLRLEWAKKLERGGFQARFAHPPPQIPSTPSQRNKCAGSASGAPRQRNFKGLTVVTRPGQTASELNPETPAFVCRPDVQERLRDLSAGLPSVSPLRLSDGSFASPSSWNEEAHTVVPTAVDLAQIPSTSCDGGSALTTEEPMMEPPPFVFAGFTPPVVSRTSIDGQMQGSESRELGDSRHKYVSLGAQEASRSSDHCETPSAGPEPPHLNSVHQFIPHPGLHQRGDHMGVDGTQQQGPRLLKIYAQQPAAGVVHGAPLGPQVLCVQENNAISVGPRHQPQLEDFSTMSVVNTPVQSRRPLYLHPLVQPHVSAGLVPAQVHLVRYPPPSVTSALATLPAGPSRHPNI